MPEDGTAGGTDGRGRPRWTRLEWCHVALLLLVTAGHWAPRLVGPIDLRYDAGVYYILGTAIAQGDGYRLLSEPGEIEGIQYPPLLPAWVAAHQIVLGSSDPLIVGQALRITNFVLSLLLAVAVYALARRLLAPWLALFAGLASVCYFHTVFLQDLLFAELPFSLLGAAFLLACGDERPRVRALAYPLAGAAFFLRTAGIALLGAWFLAPLFRRDWRAAAMRGVFCATFFLAWQGHVWSVKHAPEYDEPAYPYQRAPYQHYNVTYAENVALRNPFAPEEGRVGPANLVVRAVVQSPQLLLGIGESVSAPHGFFEWPLMRLDRRLSPPDGGTIPLWPASVPVVILGVAACVGLFHLWRAEHRVLVLFVLCSLSLIVITPWPAQFSRYLAPLSPLLSIALADSLGRLWSRWRWAAVLLGVLVPASQAFALKQTFTIYRDEIRYERPDGEPLRSHLFFFSEARLWKPFYEGLWWLRDHTPPDALVVSSCPHLVYLHAGRKAVMPPLEDDVEKAARFIDAVPADYVVVDGHRFVNVSQKYAAPVVEADPETWEVVHRDPGGKLTIYGRRR